MKRLLIPAAILVSAGLVTIASVSPHLFRLQLAWVLVGVVFLVIAARFRLIPLLTSRWVYWGLYGISIFLLVVVLFLAPVIRNTKSWIVLGPFTLQPVELLKVALVVLFANYFSRRHVKIAELRTILGSLALFVLPALLVLAQPDLGSTLVLFGIWFGFLLLSGLPPRYTVVAVVLLVLVGVAGWAWGLEGYQRARVVGFLYPEENVLGVNYSTIQSKVAIGSAGLWGKGYGQGSQLQLGFLTEPATDFIFAAFVEEWGLVGAVFLLGAFAALVGGVVSVGMRAEHNIGRFVALGMTLLLLSHFALNIGSTLGLLPVVGVPLPFVSYGGSHLVMSFVLLAIVNAIGRQAWQGA